MYINDKPISEFGAKLLNYTVSGSAVESQYLKSSQGTGLSLLNQEFGVKKLTVNLDFLAGSRNEVTHKVALFVFHLKGKVEITLPDDYRYTSILMEIGEPVQVMDTLFTVRFTFDCMQHLPMQTVELTDSGVIKADGTLSADCIMEISPGRTIANFKINEITITLLTENKPFVIDGINKKVTESGNNAILKTDLNTFPKLDPGENVITMSSPVNVTIKYYPTFL